jgi:hypothetical protein
MLALESAEVFGQDIGQDRLDPRMVRRQSDPRTLHLCDLVAELGGGHPLQALVDRLQTGRDLAELQKVLERPDLLARDQSKVIRDQRRLAEIDLALLTNPMLIPHRLQRQDRRQQRQQRGQHENADHFGADAQLHEVSPGRTSAR